MVMSLLLNCTVQHPFLKSGFPTTVDWVKVSARAGSSYLSTLWVCSIAALMMALYAFSFIAVVILPSWTNRIIDSSLDDSGDGVVPIEILVFCMVVWSMSCGGSVTARYFPLYWSPGTLSRKK